MKTIIETIDALNGQQAKAKLEVFTDVKMNKKSKDKVLNPYTKVLKRSVVVVQLIKPYADAVNEQLEKEGKDSNFVAQERKWGEQKGSFVEKGETLYLPCIFEELLEVEYLTINDSGIAVTLSKDDLSPFMPASKSSDSQGTDAVVQYRNYKLENISSIEIL